MREGPAFSVEPSAKPPMLSVVELEPLSSRMPSR